jgi:copper chaperone NosL
MKRALPPLLAMFLLGSCGGGPAAPVEIDTRNDACAWCRMAISDPRFAAQVVAPAEEPKLFDDLGCLRSWLRGGAPLPSGAAAWVADHRTRGWVLATEAVYAEVPGLATPMASGLVAWSDETSKASDPDSAGGASRTEAEIFGGSLPSGSRP